MKNPLDTRQYTPYRLDVPSGNIHTEEGVDFFNIILLEQLTGDFSLTGSFGINGESVYAPDPNNEVTDNGRSHMFGGINNVVTGTDNTIVSSSNSTVAGQNNTIIGGVSNDVSGDYSTAIGSYVNILHTGAMVLKDSLFTIGEDLGDDTLAMYFNGGIFLQNQTYVDDAFWITGGDFLISGYNITTTNDINVGGSGMFSGDVQILGTPYHTGSKLQNLADMLSHSGSLKSDIKLVSGILQTGVDNSLSKENGGIVTGAVTFLAETFIASGQAISSTGSAGNSLYLHQWSTGLGYHGSGEFDNSLHFKIDGGNGDMTHHGSGNMYFRDRGFSVSSNDELLFGINKTGHAYFRNSIMIDPVELTIPTSHDSFGVKGQTLWNTGYIFICTGWVGGGNSGWARIANGGW